MKYNTCGNCNLFMTHQCPREPGNPKLKLWNSIGSPICNKFDRSSWSINQEELDRVKAEQDRLDEIERRRNDAECMKGIIDMFF